MERLRAVEREGLKASLPEFDPGDTVRVMVRAGERARRRSRRSRPRSTGWSGGGRGRCVSPVLQADSRTARLEAPAAGAAGHARPCSAGAGARRRRGRRERARNRSPQHPAGIDPRDAARPVPPAVRSRLRPGGRPPDPGARLPARSDRGRRRPLPLHRRRIGHREDGARRVDGAARRAPPALRLGQQQGDRKSTRLYSSHTVISYAVFCLKKKKKKRIKNKNKKKNQQIYKRQKQAQKYIEETLGTGYNRKGKANSIINVCRSDEQIEARRV